MSLESLTFPEALDYLTGGATSTKPRGPSKAAPRPANKALAGPSGMPEADALALVEAAAARLWTPEGADGMAYLTGPERGLAPETIRAARLGWTPRAEGVAWRPPGVVVPWFVGERLALVKIRPPDEWRKRFPPEKRPPKYLEAFRDPARVVCYPGLSTIRAGLPLIAVEGEFDCLALGEALDEMASVVSLGSASAEPTPDILGRFLAASPWFIATDADPAGEQAAARWQAYPRARRVRPPAPYKDWTEARNDGVNLRRWWGDIYAGNDHPQLFTDEEAAEWRWGPAVGDGSPGIIVPAIRRTESPEK